MTDQGENPGRIQKSFFAIQAVTLACEAVVRSEVNPPSPKPDWFDAFQEDLREAKSLAGEWVNDISKNALTETPKTVIAFQDAVREDSQEVLRILELPPAEVSPETAGRAGSLLSGIGRKVDAIVEKTPLLQNRLRQWGQRMTRVSLRLQKRVSDIQGSQAQLSSKLEALKGSIRAMEEEVQKGAGDNPAPGFLSTVVTGVTAGVSGAASVILAPVGLFLDLFSPEAEAPRPHPLIESIRQARNAFSESERHFADLTLLSTSMDHAAGAIDMAVQSLTPVETMWRSFRLLLDDARASLKNSHAGQPPEQIRINLKVAFLQWEEGAKAAKRLLQQQEASSSA